MKMAKRLGALLLILGAAGGAVFLTMPTSTGTARVSNEHGVDLGAGSDSLAFDGNGSMRLLEMLDFDRSGAAIAVVDRSDLDWLVEQFDAQWKVEDGELVAVRRMPGGRSPAQLGLRSAELPWSDSSSFIAGYGNRAPSTGAAAALLLVYTVDDPGKIGVFLYADYT